MISKIKSSIVNYVKSRIEDEEQQMQKFVKQLNDTFPENPLQKSQRDCSEAQDSFDPLLSESEYQAYREKVGSLLSLIRALRSHSPPEKSSGQQSTKSQPESTTSFPSITKLNEKDS